MPVATIVNACAIILGSLIGVLLGRNFPDRVRTIVYQGIGLSVLVIGIDMALKYDNIVLVVFSVLLGAVTGELLRLDQRLTNLGNILKNRIKSRDTGFTDGFVTASLIFCIGSMAILGSIDEGIRGERTILLTKSILDGFISIPLASTYGMGVLFSALPVLIYQGSITIAASQSQAFFTPMIITQITAVGGLLIMGIGISLLDIKKVNVTNLLPSIVYVVFFAWILN
ncbi:DUF554 domain-containing protein [Desulfonatronovibrio magnus]|uniref:DUF554 domain-containing protein n=1 Tax=Desulfonatronovibrio magnus TaxID=698827 RepID=UPI0005EB7785|nr:DUF554 domain-containing protein [Desulfonatronovibrio magnus]RQD56264.1 MAG: DUF554 domain-containing protein [Desulfonatronovibrio sp. MSAO_Bac4]